LIKIKRRVEAREQAPTGLTKNRQTRRIVTMGDAGMMRGATRSSH
jgi:hypothetical protein